MQSKIPLLCKGGYETSSLISPKGDRTSHLIGGSPLHMGDWIMLCLWETEELRVPCEVSYVFFCSYSSRVLFASSSWLSYGGQKRGNHSMHCLHIRKPWFVYLYMIHLCGWWLRTDFGWSFCANNSRKFCEWLFTVSHRIGDIVQVIPGRSKNCMLLVYSLSLSPLELSFLVTQHNLMSNF